MTEVMVAGANDIVYTMTSQEFAIMAAAAGIRQFYGLDMGFALPNQQKFINGLHRMVQKGMIQEENGRFILSNFYVKFFAGLKTAEDVLVVHQGMEASRLKCVYLGEQLWLTETDGAAMSRIRCRQLSREGLVNLLEEENYLPITFDNDGCGDDNEVIGANESNRIEEIVRKEQKGNFLGDTQKLLQDEDCLLLIERYGFNGKNVTLEMQLAIKKSVTGYVLERMSGSRKLSMEYTLGAFRAEMRGI